MKQGKMLEILVSLIEKTLQEYDYVEIRHDVYLSDKDGIERQIDVLIEVDLGVRLGKQRIIVECKDRTSKVTVGEVGSFLDLMESLNASKGIIVSKPGFQSGAVKKATGSNGKVLLYGLDGITSNEVVEWVSEPMYKFGYQIDPSQLSFTINSESKLELDSEKNLMSCGLYQGSKHLGTFENFTLKILQENTDVIHHHLSKEALQLRKIEGSKSEGNLNLEINFVEPFYISHEDKMIGISSITVRVFATLIKIKSDPVKTAHYKEFYSQFPNAQISTAEFEDSTFNIIKNLETGKNRFFVITKGEKPEVIEIFDLGILKDN